MKSKYLLLFCAALGSLFTAINPLHAQGTGFTYQGRLADNGSPANGDYDLTFAVFDAESSGPQVGATLTNSAVAVSNGLFTVALDFGPAIFAGPDRWLEIGVRPNGTGDFATLSPRQSLTASPYAIFAGTAANVAGGSVVTGLNGLKDEVTLAAGNNVTLTPNGNTLTIAAAGAGGSGIWSLNGAATYYNGGNVGVGTTTPANKLTVFSPFYGVEHTDGSVRLATYLGGSTGGGWLGTISPHPLSFFVNDGSASMTVATSGNVGIGTSTPTSKLDIAGAQDALKITGYQPVLTMRDSSSANARGVIQSVAGGLNLFTESYMSGANSFAYVSLNNSGNLGIGSATPASKLEVVAQDALRLIGYQPFLTIVDSNAGYARSRIQGAGGEMLLVPESYLNGSDGNAYVKLFNSGNLSVKTLTIRGGADLAEPFELSAADVTKGSVVVIDSENPGKLKLSDQPYDQRVAGVVSGANGINPGISLHQEEALDGGQNVALSGRVYAQADAAFGGIKPGDLLTSSATPGHAMKVSDHAKAQGAILGKAMSGLKEGKGMVLVLVTLQ